MLLTHVEVEDILFVSHFLLQYLQVYRSAYFCIIALKSPNIHPEYVSCLCTGCAMCGKFIASPLYPRWYIISMIHNDNNIIYAVGI